MTKRPTLTAKRASLTPGERAAMYQAQEGWCGCGCGEKLGPLNANVIGEHVYDPVALGNADKPDSLWRRDCADRKTNGVRGDKSWIAHIKRLAFNRTQHDDRKANGGTRIRSPGFRKDIRKRMNGKVERRS